MARILETWKYGNQETNKLYKFLLYFDIVIIVIKTLKHDILWQFLEFLDMTSSLVFTNLKKHDITHITVKPLIRHTSIKAYSLIRRTVELNCSIEVLLPSSFLPPFLSPILHPFPSPFQH